MRLSLLLGALAALVVVGGCGKGNFSEEANVGKENVFRYPIPNKPTTLDPGAVEDGHTIDLIQQVFEGLVAYGPDNKIQGILAEKWDISEDGKTYTFHIKHGVKFHNGRELKAQDFKDTIERNCDPNFQTTTAEAYLSDIVGVSDKIHGRATEVSGVKPIDDYTLQITIDEPRPYFLGKLTYPVSWVIAKEAFHGTDRINTKEQMIGTGPFKVAEYRESEITILDANKDYHLGAPKIARIERPVIMDPEARLLKYTQGEIDLVQLERQDVPPLMNDPKFKGQLQFFDRPSIFYVGMNQRVYPAFKDVRVRRAFAMAIDKHSIVQNVLGGLVNEANSIVPPGVPGHRENAATIPFDPAGARKLLAEAGYPGGKGLPKFLMEVRQEIKDYRDVAEAAAMDLQKNLNIQVETSPTEWATYLAKRNKWQVGLFHMRWAADYLDPQNFLSMMLGTYSENPPFGPENRMDYSNKEFDRLCKQADTMVGHEEERLKLYAQAEDIVLQDAPWVPIYFQRDAELISPRVKGLRTNLFGHLPHYTVSLE